MNFAGQENPLIIFRSKKDTYKSKQITESNKIAEIFLGKKVF